MTGLRYRLEKLEDKGKSLLLTLLSIPSVSPEGDKYSDIIEALKGFFAEESVETDIIKIPESYQREKCPEAGSNPRYILRAYNEGEGPKLHFNAHYDVVPGGPGWTVTRPFEPKISGTRIYGRGATDMKGGLVSIAMAMAALSGSPYNVEAIFVPDEEIGGRCGTGYYTSVVMNRSKPDYVVIGEPSTLERIWIGHKGGLWVRVVVEGRTAHASTPWMGRNAYIAASKLALGLHERLAGLLNKRISSYRYDFPQSNRPSFLVGGEAGVVNGKSNQVPGKAFFTIDRRLIVEENVEDAEKEVFLLVSQLRKDLGLEDYGVHVEVTTKMNPVIVEQGNVLSKAIKEASVQTGLSPPEEIVCTGGLDLRYYIEKGVLGVAYGPGVPGVEHAPDEYIDYRSVVKAAEVYSLLPGKLAGKPLVK